MSKSKDFATPIAIVVAGVVIAAALYFALGNKAQAPSAEQREQEVSEINIRPIQENDLVKGNRNADLVIVEFSDTECPFCKRFHEVMNKLIDAKGDKIAWVYRHFPLDQLHAKARTESEAVACAVKIGGPDKGFKYLDRLMELTPSNDGLDLKLLPEFAKYADIDVQAFNKCLENRETKDWVEKDYQEAIASGGRGTPHNIIIYKDQKMAVPGALPYEQMEKLVDDLLGS